MRLKRRDILTHQEAYMLLAFAVFAAMCVLFRHFNVDDAFISFRYARNLAEGYGAVMNPGEHVEGISNLPWTVLLAAFAWGLEPHHAGPALAILCGAACLVAVGNLTATWIEDRHAGGFAALLLALAAPFAIWSVSGLETLAYTLLVTLLIWRASVPHSHAWDVGLLLGLVASMRPEGILFALPLGVILWQRSLHHLLHLLAGTALFVGPLEIFRILYYGDWLPNPVYAKANFGIDTLAAGLVYVGKLLVAFPLQTLCLWIAIRALQGFRRALLLTWVLVPFSVAIVAGGERFPAYRLLVPLFPALGLAAEVSLRAWRRRALSEAPVPRGVWIGTVLGPVGLVAAVFPNWVLPLGRLVLGLVHTYRSDHESRLLDEARFAGVVLFLTGLLLAIAPLLHAALRRVQVVSERAARASLGVIVHESAPARRAMGIAMLLVLTTTVLPTALDPSIRPARQPDPAVVYGRAVGHWLAQAFGDSTRVATNAAGGLPYASGLPVIDMLGLTDAHIARTRQRERQWPGHERGDGAYVLSRCPEILILGGAEGSETPWPFAGDQEIARAPAFARDYVLERQALEGFEFVYYRRRDAPPPLR